MHLPHDLRRIDPHRLGDANQLDDVEPARAALDLGEIRRGEAELRGHVRLLELGALAGTDEHLAEDAQLAGKLRFGGDAVGAAIARFHLTRVKCIRSTRAEPSAGPKSALMSTPSTRPFASRVKCISEPPPVKPSAYVGSSSNVCTGASLPISFPFSTAIEYVAPTSSLVY